VLHRDVEAPRNERVDQHMPQQETPIMPTVMDDLATRLLEDFDETEHIDLRPTLTGARLVALLEGIADEQHESSSDERERLMAVAAPADAGGNGFERGAS
jgi:hypothetical protein